MTNYVVSAGHTSVGISMSASDQLSVAGLAVDTVDNGGDIQIISGGVMSRTTLDDGAYLVISAGGSAVSGTADATSEVVVASGGQLSNFTVSGLLKLDDGVVAYQDVVARGGVAVVSGAAEFGAVAAGGTEYVLGADIDGTVAGVQLIVGGLTMSDEVLSGGLQEVNAAGDAESGTVDSGGSEVVDRFGNVYNMTVESGGGLSLGGEASYCDVSGAMFVLSGGLSEVSMVAAGGVETVSSGGSSVEDQVQGVLTVLDGGQVIETYVEGKELVASGALDLSALIVQGLQLVSGGTASLGRFEAGGKLEVIAGGVAWGAAVSSGSKLTIGSGGLANLTSLSIGASALVLSGGVASGGRLDSGASETISKGGQDRDETVEGTLNLRGYATGDQFLDHGQVVVLSGGVLISATIGSAGEAALSSGGKTSATQVTSGGIEAALKGGVTSGATIFANGQEVVGSGGVASHLTLSSGGIGIVEAGGEIEGLSLASGATLTDSGQVLLDAGTLNGTLLGAGSIIAAHGMLVLSGDGSAFDGRAVISGGRLELAVAGAIGSGQVVFSGGNGASQTLQIDGAAAPVAGGTFANTISNFNAPVKAIDLRGLAFVSGAHATLSSSTLTLVDGGRRYGFHLEGLVGKSFSVAADGSGGTEIVAHATAAFTQALAVLAAPAAALQSPVSGFSRESSSPLHAAAAPGRN